MPGGPPMFDVMFWRRRRPWWQRLGAGFDLKVPSFEAPEVEVPRFRMPWERTRRFEAPQLPSPHFWARWPWESMDMPRFRKPDVSTPWFRTPDVSMPWLRTPDVSMPRFRAPEVAMPWLRAPEVEMPSFEMPRFDDWKMGLRWLRRFEAPRARMPDMPSMPSQRFDFGRWWPYLALAALAGGLLVYFLDPQGGRRRRAMARDRLGAQFRHTGRRLARTGRGVGAWGYGVSQRATHPRFAGEPVDDVALVDRVRAEMYRHGVAREHLSINAARGIVELRGQVGSRDDIGRVESLVRRVPGVYDVHNYLHTPGTPAPNKADALSFR
ncbi:MAG TPA: BON domain-containing protein [Chloroflexota bacterium]